ncbi:DUF418 domain-containing protein [Chondromyces crocatus]|nr:DUF418 domain-containing protein [Chondromyces crocatus]
MNQESLPSPGAVRAERALAPDETPSAAEPTAPADRLDVLDALRGVALFGILAVNLTYWFRDHPSRSVLDPDLFRGVADRAAEFAVITFFNGKFLTLFAMLFGAGLALQREHALARGGGFHGRALRRLAVLLLFGVAHVGLLWMGDVLHVYALLGPLLLLFLGCTTRTLTFWAALVFALPPILVTCRLVVGGLARAVPPVEELESARQHVEVALQVYGHGGWLEVARYRIHDYVQYLPTLLPAAYAAFGSFLVGVLVWRSGVVQEPARHRASLRRMLIGGLVLGVGVTLLEGTMSQRVPSGWRGLVDLVSAFQPAVYVAQALAYGAGVLLLLQRPGWGARFSWVTAAGRMALSCYLLQSLLCGIIFYGYGFGLYGHLGPAAGLLVVFGIYAVELALSRWWLSRYRFGPLEWLWRTLTYGKRQPMRS